MTTATVGIWRDTGYTEGCLEVPKTSSSLPSPDLLFENLEISRSSMMSELKLRAPYESLYDCSYVRVAFDFKNGDDVTVYGWIDSVTCSSDTEGSPMTIVAWHPDLWRTYISKAVIGSGTVLRRSATGEIPPQPYSPRYVSEPEDERITIVSSSDVMWVCFYLNAKVGSDTVSAVCTFPVSRASPDSNLSVSGELFIGTETGTVTGTCPSFRDVVCGIMDERMSLDPEAIAGCWISFQPPAAMSDAPYSASGWKLIKNDKGSYLLNLYYNSSSSELATFDLISTTDTRSWAVLDFDGHPVGYLPWGLKVNRCSTHLIITPTDGVIELRFLRDDELVSSAPVEGLCFRVPLPTVTVSSNSYSSYIYSGARSAEIAQRSTDRKVQLASGLASVFSQGAEGAMAGGMMAAMGGMGLGAGMAVGGVTSAGGGLLSTVAGFGAGVATDGMVQRSLDRVRAAQTPATILSGTGFDFLQFGGFGLKLAPLDWDGYSAGVRSDDIATYGAHVEEARASCQSLITAGGPVQIVNATVTGQIPTDAKTYIRARLAQGVVIK